MTNKDNIKVLIAEDDYLVNEEISRIIKDIGWDLIGNAYNGIQAIEMTSSLKPDLIFMDIKMPGASGLVATQKIQEICPTPVIIMSAHDTSDLIVKAGNVGASAYLVKPPEKQEIQRAATIAIARHKELMSSNLLNVRLQNEINTRKQTEINLRKSEANLQSLINNKSDAVWSIDEKYKVLTINDFFKKEFFKVFKIELNEGINIIESLPEDLRNIWKPKYDKALSGKQLSFEFSHQIVGEERFYEAHLNPIIVNNKVTGVSALSLEITERKIAEKTILKSEKSFKNIFNNAIDAIYVLDKDHKFIDVNLGAVKMYGFSKEELIGQTPNSVSAPGLNDLEMIGNYIEIALKGEPQQFEFWGQRKNKESFLKLVRVSSGYYFGEKVVLAFAIDITERKKTEQALKESEERFRNLSELLPETIFETDRRMNLVYVNNRALELFGYTKDDLEKGLNAMEMFVPEEHRRMKKNWLKKKEEKKLESHEYLAIKKDGTKFPVLFHDSNIIKNNSYKGARGIIIDITERKKTEQALKESEENYRLLVQNQGEGISITDENEIFIYTNPAAEKIFGVEKGGLVNQSLRNFMSQKTLSFIRKETKIRKSGKLSRYEIEIIQPAGNYIDIHVTATPHTDENGKFLGTFAVFRDITQQKKAEILLKNNEKELRKLNATKDKFFSIIAHDLRSPIGSLLSFADLLKDKFTEYDELKQKRFLNIIHQRITDIFKLLENLLIWSKSQSKTIEFDPKSENLYLLVNETIKILGQMAVGKSINIKNEIAEDINIHVDKNMILTIFRNLISNAVKFTPKGGSIKFTGNIKTNDNNEDIINISITDTGIGMNEETQSKLFDITKNTSSKGTEKETGSGLGLIICNEFVKIHKGEITVESEINKGSKFNITLPYNLKNDLKHSEE